MLNASSKSITFIADLHLHPDEQETMLRFHQFIDWAHLHACTVYILGDFFHAWSGDDCLDTWSISIAERLAFLSKNNIAIYFLHGNRDFLLGNKFANLAGMTIIPDQTLIQLNEHLVLLAHGDRYCTLDKSHQLFRRLTRNQWFISAFLNLPLRVRSKMVSKIRQHSQLKKPNNPAQMDIVVPVMLSEMQKKKAFTLIHGHTHKPGLLTYKHNDAIFNQYILSDWGDSHSLLCYHDSIGFHFNQIFTSGVQPLCTQT